MTVLISVICPSTVQWQTAHEPDQDLFQTIEHDGLRVTFLETTETRTPNGKHASTSFLFLVENNSNKVGNRSHNSPVRLYDDKNSMLFSDASNGSPKTGCIVMDYAPQNENGLPTIPKVKNVETTMLVRHWIATRLPKNITSVEADFGIDGNNKAFRFSLQSE